MSEPSESASDRANDAMLKVLRNMVRNMRQGMLSWDDIERQLVILAGDPGDTPYD